jgi:hypothetical protein
VPIWDRKGFLESLFRSPQPRPFERQGDGPAPPHEPLTDTAPADADNEGRSGMRLPAPTFWRAVWPYSEAGAAVESGLPTAPIGRGAAATWATLERLASHERSPVVMEWLSPGPKPGELDAMFKRYGVASFFRLQRQPNEEEAKKFGADAQEHMQARTVQFFLRSIGRVERDTDEAVGLVPSPTRRISIRPDELREVGETLRRRPAAVFSLELASKILVEHSRAQRQLLAFEDWTRFAGESVRNAAPGPLWKFFPDDAAFAQWGSPTSVRLAGHSQESGQPEPSLSRLGSMGNDNNT